MAYKALYRTYRPKTFLEVAGQKHIVKTIENALANNKIAHAYLFCGPRGTGKTSMAKLFAKSLNCEESFGHQCNQCGNCLSVNDGSHPDVIEIDAASNNGVEEVRDLIEKVKYLPIKGKYKVYIIDEVHMMTSGAFNALLKTLEEPPAHVVFILATTEPHKVIPTIVSRCQRYDFTKVEDDAIREKMVEILNLEEINYDIPAINAIIDLADGGVRDALSILEHVLAYAGNTIKEKDVFDLFGLASTKEKLDLVKAIAKGDVKDVLKRMESFIASGIDIKRLTTNLLDVLKDALIYSRTEEQILLSVLTEKDVLSLIELISVDRLNEMIEILLKAQNDFKVVSNIRSLFELVLLRLTTSSVKKMPIDDDTVHEIRKPDNKSIVKQEAKKEDSIIKKIEPVTIDTLQPEIERLIEQPKAIEPAPLVETNGSTVPSWLLEDEMAIDEKNRPAIEVKSKDKNQPSQCTINVAGEKNTLDDETLIKIMVLGDKEERQNISKKWDEFNGLVAHPRYGLVASLLKDGRPYIVAKNVLVLEYDFDCLAERINITTNQEAIVELMKGIVGRELFVYAIVRSEALRLQKSFFNLRQLNRLPKAKDIQLDLKGATI
ncbi:MAG: DNA polymerase III subunit gamma/tau [Bacilli bacterium]|jgi:DNA polymerase-3 subunit gamma/tau|nr:DNA polymerase III subunit gamma/tau [Bacilli bacterium]